MDISTISLFQFDSFIWIPSARDSLASLISELTINFENGKEKLCPGDSCYIKPFLKHNFRGNGKILCLRIGGKIGGDPQRELSIIGKKNSERAISESMPWFNAEGRN